jgi:hypothetical protein
VIEPLLNVLEDMASDRIKRTTIIFTTTVEGNDLFEEQLDAGPFASRVISILLARRDLAGPFAERCKQIATQAGLDGKPVEEYLKLASEKLHKRRGVELKEVGEGEEVRWAGGEGLPSLHHRNLLFRQPVKLIHYLVYQFIRGGDFSLQRRQFYYASLELELNGVLKIAQSGINA